jgi:galactokinase
VWAAPGRVNVIGEHVDYNAGLCLPFALPHRTFAAVALRDDGMVRVRSAQVDGGWEGPLDEIAPGVVQGWAGYAVGVPWALRQAGYEVPGLDVVLDGRVPLGSGLSSSAALECAVALAVDELAGLRLGADDAGRARLAAACVRAETEIAGAPTGGLDQAASLRCERGKAMLLDCRDFSVELIPFDLASAGLSMLIMDTRSHHALTDGLYGSRRSMCEDAVRILEVQALRDVAPADLHAALARLPHDEMRSTVRHVVTEIARVEQVAALLRDGRIAEIGAILDISHRSMRDDFKISSVELDLAVEAARSAGALGARMTGGGFGGSAIALCPADAVDAVAQRVADAFEVAEFSAPMFLAAAPSDPASRVL